MFGLDELLEIMPTPGKPVMAHTDAEWMAIFATIGTRLPGDYVAALKAFGLGCFFPQSHRMSANLIWHEWRPASPGNGVFGCLNEFRAQKLKRKNAIPFPLYFEDGGLLPWGRLTNDSHICWITVGNFPDRWTTAIVRPASSEAETFEMSAMEFLARLIKGTIKPALMPAGFPGSKGIGFQPWGVPQPPCVLQRPLK